MGRFFVTTPIYYVNAPAHLGHAYTSLACDTLARWRRLMGDEVFFLTGLDEHGGNIEKVARAAGVEPRAWCDRIAAEDCAFFADLGISHDDFIRTTEERHRAAVEAFWTAAAAAKTPKGRKAIIKGEYEGLYCIRCEAYYVEADLAEGKCPVHREPLDTIKEEAYFFRLSDYQEFLEEHLEANPAFVVPEIRRNEVLGLVREGLRDVSISRTKVQWGIPVPGDPAHVIYVWFDALVNYLTACGYPDRSAARWRFWPADLHVVGKEIIRFHALLWPAMLQAAGLPLPRKIAVHGWWTIEGRKISKSLGNAVDPRTFAAKYSFDAVRHFLLAEKAFGADGDFSERRLVERYNSDLANVFGNLAHRTISMAFRYLGGVVPAPSTPSPWDGLAELPDRIGAALAEPRFQEAVEIWMEFAKRGNKYLDDRAPWNQPEAERAETLAHVLVLLEALSWVTQAFLPAKSAALRRQLGFDVEREAAESRRSPLPRVFRLVRGDPLFPRIDTRSGPGGRRPTRVDDPPRG